MDVSLDVLFRKCNPVHHRIPVMSGEFGLELVEIGNISLDTASIGNLDLSRAAIEQVKFYSPFDAMSAHQRADVPGASDKEYFHNVAPSVSGTFSGIVADNDSVMVVD